MAIKTDDSFNHHRVENVSRKDGRSAVKSAAYITGEKLYDERTGLTYGRAESKGRVLATGTVGPAGTSFELEELWSAAEKAETRSNSRVAQSHTLALPHELSDEAHKRLLNGFCLWHRDTYKVAATWALHAPDAQGDSRNKHGHILTTTRAVSADEHGKPVFRAKVREIHGHREAGSKEIERQRAEWAKRVNKELERAGSPRRLDHRSFERRAEAGDGPQGLEPGTHKQPKVSARARKARAGKLGESAAVKAKSSYFKDQKRTQTNAKKMQEWAEIANLEREAKPTFQSETEQFLRTGKRGLQDSLRAADRFTR